MGSTNWQGLWAQEREGFYAGKVIKKTDIPEYTRIVLRYNKFYEKDGNKPRFVYCFSDSDGYKEKCIPMEYEDSVKSKIDELAEVMRQGNVNAECGGLPSETQSRADSLMKRAIELVEEITGEEWEFSYLTWG